VVMKALAEELVERGHDATVLTSQALNLPPETSENGVNVIRAPVFFRRHKQVATLPSMAAYLPMGLYRAMHLHPRDRFDIINTHFVLPSGPVGHLLTKYCPTSSPHMAATSTIPVRRARLICIRGCEARCAGS